jgi:hypothetical protein
MQSLKEKTKTITREESTQPYFLQFPVGTHKLEVAPKPWDRTTEIGKIPAGETGVNKPMGLSTKKSISLGEKEEGDKLLCKTHTHTHT